MDDPFRETLPVGLSYTVFLNSASICISKPPYWPIKGRRMSDHEESKIVEFLAIVKYTTWLARLQSSVEPLPTWLSRKSRYVLSFYPQWIITNGLQFEQHGLMSMTYVIIRIIVQYNTLTSIDVYEDGYLTRCPMNKHSSRLLAGSSSSHLELR